ncbi:MAG: hypothetical protein AAGD07_17160 [Planctomycetota bacterium]
MNGVAVTDEGRVFVSMPQWTAVDSPSVAEVDQQGNLKPFPGGTWNEFDVRCADDRSLLPDAMSTRTRNLTVGI